MTFELVVWRQTGTISAEQAAATDRDTLDPAAAVAAFHTDLAGLAPDAEVTAPESRYAVVTMTPDRVDEVSSEVYALARDHELICYDPERALVHNLGPLGAYRGMQLHSGDGLVVIDPDLGLIDAALQRLGPQNPFTSLVVFGEHFIQTSPENDTYELEYKEDTLHRTSTGLAEVRLAFNEYATGERAFLHRHAWQG
ncbi:hypothetical protein [Actinomadura flavalba]|uniref:hypothetical protein n=1 Tax=Actinomadura flavalba TaxID=1120938 RepID=UPI00036778BC|nr:hypothetical protein [Actinomadura flavalba]